MIDKLEAMLVSLLDAVYDKACNIQAASNKEKWGYSAISVWLFFLGFAALRLVYAILLCLPAFVIGLILVTLLAGTLVCVVRMLLEFLPEKPAPTLEKHDDLMQ